MVITDEIVYTDAIDWLIEIPKKNSNRIFLIDDASNQNITFDQLHREACVISSSLIQKGINKGDRIVIIQENSLSLVNLYFGCLYAGIVIVPVNPILSQQEMKFIINQCRAKAVVVSQNTLAKIDIHSFIQKGIIVINSDLDDLKSISQSFEPFTGVSSNDELAIFYTSGTTAEPKGVVHRIRDLVDNARIFGKEIGITPTSRFCNILSLTYLGGYYNLLLLPYVCEASVVLTKTFDSKSIINFWKPVILNNVNTLWLVPSIISILMEMDRGTEGSTYCKNNVFFALVGTAPLPLQIRLDFEKKYGIRIYEDYGMSETLFITTNSHLIEITNGSVGRVLPGVFVKIVDKNNEEVPREIEGEIIVKTPFLMLGYYNSQKGTPDFINDDTWFETGDIGFLSKNGNLFITGRKKDLIIRGGINISPASIENVIYRNPSVLECAVIGIPHKFQGEEICVVIRLKSSEDFEKVKKELFDLCRKNLSTIKQPDKIIQLREFPHSTYGKIQKRKIRSWILHKSSSSVQPALYVDQQNELSKKKTEFTPSKIVMESVEALSIKYNTLVYEKQRKGEDIIVLSLGEAFFDIPLFAFDDLPQSKIYHYSHSRGIPELRDLIAKYFLETYDVTIDYEREILITAGSKIAIYMALMAIINPGDEVIVHEPAWVSFTEQIKLCYGVPVHVPYYETVFDFEKYVTEKTKMIIINNPNNPTGKIFNLEELSYLHKIAEKYNLYVLSDEAYSDFLLDEDEFISFANLDTEKKHSVIVNSMSKNFGISGWRIGYVIANPVLINEILKLNQHLITCPATILEYYLVRHFSEIINITKPQMKALVKKRQDISNFMNSISLNFLSGTATYYFFVSIEDSTLTSEEFCRQMLLNFHVSVVPGIGYGKSCDKFIRISIGSENLERIQKALYMIKNLISKTSKYS